MARLFPAPLLSAVLFVTWLLLNGVSSGHLALALVLAVSIPWLTERFRADRPACKHGRSP